MPERVRAVGADGDKVGICTPILAELVGGVLHSQSPERNLAILRSRTAHLSLWIFDKAAAYEYGAFMPSFAGSGGQMPVPDIQITAIALSLGNAVVVSKDSDLISVPALAVEDRSLP